MSLKIPIPKELAHLKIDERGYPIPFFVSYVDSKPEFRFLKHEKLMTILDHGLCHVCGKKLPKDFFYFIAGPHGLKNKVGTDAPDMR